MSRPDDADALRRVAEARLRTASPADPVELARLVHELQVHQVELEMQNNELLQARAEREVALTLYTELYEFAPVGYFSVDRRQGIGRVNLAGARLLGVDRADLIARPFADFIVAESRPVFAAALQRAFASAVRETCEVTVPGPAATAAALFLRVDLAVSDDGEICRAVVTDITEARRLQDALTLRLDELTVLNGKLEAAQNHVLQADKMATVGQLAAGVAHEINNPIAFVNANLGTLVEYVEDLLEVLEKTEESARADPDLRRAGTLARLKAEKDFDFLQQDIRKLLLESLDGAERVRQIVQNLKDFSHVSDEEWAWCDLQAGLDSTLNLVWNELRYKAEVDKHYAALPKVFCVGAQINQVLMNLLVNAAQAIASRGKLTLSTGVCMGKANDEAAVWVEIRDTGAGIPPAILNRIFDPFFTTKPVGQGTGLGLSLAWSIVQKHQGTITVDSEVGVGTRFRVTLPVRGKDPAAQGN